MSTERVLFLNEDRVRAVLEYDELIPAMRRALMDLSAGRGVQPLRTVMRVAEHSGWFAVMPVVYGGVMGAKLVTFYPGNVELKKHTHMAMIQLFRRGYGRAARGDRWAADYGDEDGGGVCGGRRSSGGTGCEGAGDFGEWGAGAVACEGADAGATV